MSDSSAAAVHKVCVVVGVGEGLGAGLARRFAAGYKVALVARSADVIEKEAREIKSAGGVALPVQSDATVEAEIAAAYERITGQLGPIEILIYNGGRRPIGRLLETTPEVFEQTWRLHTLGAFLWARAGGAGDAVARQRCDPGYGGDRGRPAVAQLRGVRAGQVCGARPDPGDGSRPSSAGHPRRVRQRRRRHRHASARNFRPDAKDEDFLKPSAIADAFWYLAHQDRSVWTQELDVRPFKEKF